MSELVKAWQDLFVGAELSQLQPLGYWSYLVLALLVAIEGPVATFLGATAASAGWLNPFLVFAAAVSGNITADLIWYSLGYYGRVDWLLRHERWSRLNVQRWARLRREINAHAPRILFLTKLTSSLIIPALIAAGLARVPRRRWFGFLLAGECLRTGAVVALGFYIGRSVKQFELGTQVAALIGLIIIAVSLGWYLLRRKRIGRY
jgi:membrane protein DedA with SNARE-associated domain